MTLYKFLRNFILSPLFKMFFEFKVYGADNIPKNGSFIVASNHVSLIDPVVLGVASFRELHYVAKESLFYNKFFGNFLYKINAFAVKRNFQDAGAIKEAIRRLKAGYPLVVFPEGTRSLDGSLQQPKFGAGFLAYLAGVPIIPAFVKGSQAVLPKHAKFIRLKKMAVYFGKAIFPQSKPQGNDKKELYQKLTKTAMEQIELLGRLG